MDHNLFFVGLLFILRYDLIIFSFIFLSGSVSLIWSGINRPPIIDSLGLVTYSTQNNQTQYTKKH